MPRPKNIKSPTKLWEYFQAYRKEIEDNPFLIVEQKKGNTNIRVTTKSEQVNLVPPDNLVKLPKMRPLTMEGFENYLADLGVISDVSDYFENKNDSYKEFLPICSRIKREIRQNQIEGGMAGLFNPSITQRLNNLTDRKDVTTDDKPLVPIIGMRIVDKEERKDRIAVLRRKLGNLDESME